MGVRKQKGRKARTPEPATQRHSSGDEALRWIAEGIDLPQGDAREEAWFEDLRRQLRSLRKQQGLSQSVLAERLGRPQSEISRLENSLGPGSRIGAIRDYVRACAKGLDLKVGVSREAGEAPDEAAGEAAAQGVGGMELREAEWRRVGIAGHLEDVGVPAEVYECRVSPWLDSHGQAGSSPIGLMVAGQMFVGAEAALMQTVLKSLVQVLAEAGIQPDRRSDLIRKTVATMDQQTASTK